MLNTNKAYQESKLTEEEYLALYREKSEKIDRIALDTVLFLQNRMKEAGLDSRYYGPDAEAWERVAVHRNHLGGLLPGTKD